MSDLTPLDIAHGAMEAAPNDDAIRLAFYERLGDGELFLLLEAEAEGETIKPLRSIICLMITRVWRVWTG